MALSDQQQQELYDEIMRQRMSRSPLRSLGQGTIGRMSDLMLNTDGSTHVLIVRSLAAIGHPDMLALLHEIAEADPVQYPDRQDDKKLARAILNDLVTTPVYVKPTAPAPVAKVVEPEVLPAVREPAPVSNNTPEELLNVLGRLKVFDSAYRQKFDELTKGTEEK